MDEKILRFPDRTGTAKESTEPVGTPEAALLRVQALAVEAIETTEDPFFYDRIENLSTFQHYNEVMNMPMENFFGWFTSKNARNEWMLNRKFFNAVARMYLLRRATSNDAARKYLTEYEARWSNAPKGLSEEDRS